MIILKQNLLQKLKLLLKIKLRHIIYLGIIIVTANLFWDNMFPESFPPHIARIEINGLIKENRELLKRIKKIEQNDSVKALIVSISSQGGAGYAGEEIFAALNDVKKHKPVVANIKALGASAGYLIACASNTIVASNGSLIGSIGVVIQYPKFKDFLDKLGVSYETIQSSPMKTATSPYTEKSKEAKQMIQNAIDDFYRSFVKIVSDSRNIPYKKALLLSDGSIWSGMKAKELGLIDIIGGEKEILENLYSLGVNRNITIIKEWDAPKTYYTWFKPLDALVGMFIKHYLEIDISEIQSSDMNGLIAVWQKP